MLFKKIDRIDKLRAVLNQEQAALSANKKAAVEQQQWDYATELHQIERQLQEFMESLTSLQPALI
jgi:hypothetical protein